MVDRAVPAARVPTARTRPIVRGDILSFTAFALPDRLVRKSDPALIADDERHFAAIAAAIERRVADLSARLEAARRAPGGRGQAALDRDLEIHRVTAQLRVLRRYRLDLCLGRMVPEGEQEPVYLGRIGLADDDGRRLLVDWRAPAAEPFFAATLADPMGLASRRRYRWAGGRITEYWDEVLSPGGIDALRVPVAPDDESAFIASLGASRTARMRDVLATIQTDQDAIIRAGSHGALVVDGGPGTGKTVVALHRAAYLLYADPRLSGHRGGVLFVGPHDAYLAYVADVLPSLGEDGVLVATLGDLLPEGSAAIADDDPEASALKSRASMVDAVEPAVTWHERPPTQGLIVETPWGPLEATADDWAEAFRTPDAGTPHNDARDEVWDALLDLLVDAVLDRLDEDVSPTAARRAIARDETLAATFARAWPLLDPEGVVADLWSSTAYLRMCAPWLSEAEASALQRSEARAWTVADLPILDAARRRIGDPGAARVARRREAALAAEAEERERVAEHLIAADFDHEGLATILRGADVRESLTDDDVLPRLAPDALAGPFAHLIVDEAQELTDAQWRMLLARCPSRSFTIVGDRAQARRGFTESWEERLARVGFDDVSIASLSVNYRTPAEIMAVAAPVILAAIPDANVPTSIRSSGVPVVSGATSERDAILARWLAEHADGEGLACVIGDPSFTATSRVRSLSPEQSKGLEFDLVVLVDPDAFGEGVEGAVDRYVAMTRATGRLVVLRTESSTAIP